MFDSLERGTQELMAAFWQAAAAFTPDDGDRAVRLTGVLEVLEQAQAQLEGVKLHLLHEAAREGVNPVIDLHRNTTRHDTPRGHADLRLAEDLSERFTMIKIALAEGGVSADQASAMVFGLKKLPPLPSNVIEVCQAELLGLAPVMSPHELRHAALEVWALVDPLAAEDEERRRLEREERRADAIRVVRLSDSGHGYMTLSGKLPLADAALLQAQLDALTPPLSAYAGENTLPTREARRADALMRLSQQAASAGTLPKLGLDRPHVSITVSLETLREGIGAADLIGVDAATLSAGEARRLACDANIIPIVLGGRSEPLDIGRRSRKVTTAVRAAITRRDGGCAFPHCTMAPAVCEAHHIRPWHVGGPTSVENLVLLCPRHHRLVEPDPLQSETSQWQVWIEQTSGEPWFRPPNYIDPDRQPRQHRRHRLGRLDSDVAADLLEEQRLTPGKNSIYTDPEVDIGEGFDAGGPPPTPPGLRFPEPKDDPWHPDHQPPPRDTG